MGDDDHQQQQQQQHTTATATAILSCYLTSLLLQRSLQLRLCPSKNLYGMLVQDLYTPDTFSNQRCQNTDGIAMTKKQLHSFIVQKITVNISFGSHQEFSYAFQRNKSINWRLAMDIGELMCSRQLRQLLAMINRLHVVPPPPNQQNGDQQKQGWARKFNQTEQLPTAARVRAVFYCCFYQNRFIRWNYSSISFAQQRQVFSPSVLNCFFSAAGASVTLPQNMSNMSWRRPRDDWMFLHDWVEQLGEPRMKICKDWSFNGYDRLYWMEMVSG